MKLYDQELYLQDVRTIAELPLDWEILRGKTVMISGATGMIGSFLADVLMARGETGCRVTALGRNREKADRRFYTYRGDDRFHFVETDINKPIPEEAGQADYIFHLASNTHPVAYATDPIGTVTANIIGTANLLDYAAEQEAERFIFASSVEIYGENRGDTDRFSEDYCGYIDCNTLRAGYPESKRAGEALCQAYMRQKGVDVVIPRLSRAFGPTMLASDTKAISQFIKKGAKGEDIVLKSKGTQLYSYTYVADVVYGLLVCLMRGESGAAYNIANPEYDIMLKDLASAIAGIAGTKVVFELPDEVEQAGYSKATKATLDSGKMQRLGWKPVFDLETALRHTIALQK